MMFDLEAFRIMPEASILAHTLYREPPKSPVILNVSNLTQIIT